LSKLRYIAIGAIVAALIAYITWRQQQQMIAGLPPRITCSSQADAQAKAGPRAFPVLGTGSMAPYIPPAAKDKDPRSTVVAYAKPGDKGFADIRKGDLVTYHASWAKGFVLHQAAQKDSGGWIMSGLHNAHSESFTRITEREFVAVISEVYVW